MYPLENQPYLQPNNQPFIQPNQPYIQPNRPYVQPINQAYVQPINQPYIEQSNQAVIHFRSLFSYGKDQIKTICIPEIFHTSFLTT